MRTVVNTEEVTHLWAHRSQAEARNAGNTVYFYGDTIYSYGSHFPMARHIGSHTEPLILICSRSYSVTTSRHQSRTWQACHHLPHFTVDNVLADTKPGHLANFELMRDGYEEEINAAGRARIHIDMHLDRAENIRINANAYSRHFKLRRQIKAVTVEQLKQRAKEQAVKARAARKAARAKMLADFQKCVPEWRKGGTARLHHGYMFPALLRINGDTVETSQGVNFPLEHARRALPLVMRCIRNGRAWQRNGENIRLGYYQIDSISKTGTIKAGCHTIERAEVEHFASLLEG